MIFRLCSLTAVRVAVGLHDHGHDVTVTRVDGTAGVLTEHDHSAAAVRQLEHHAVKHDGTLGELTVDAGQAVRRITDIKLDTADQVTGVVQADLVLNGYHFTSSRWLIVAVLFDQGNVSCTERI